MNSDNKPRRIVVVLGMHRSGTSLLGSVLQVLGVKLGQGLIEGDQNNAAGYFEHGAIVRVHERLLDKLDRRWVGAKGSLAYPAGWWQAPEIQVYKAELADIVCREIESAQGLWGFKDPRTSRLLPFWKEIFCELDIAPIYLLAVRHPLAVSASISKRDGLTPACAQLLWLEHALDALRDTYGELKCVVEYDRWFTHLREQTHWVAKAVGFLVPQDDTALLSRIAIRPELRHHQFVDGDLLPYVAETYRLLLDAAISGNLPDELWQIEADLVRAQSLLRAWSEVIERTPFERRPSDSSLSGGSGSVLKWMSKAMRARLVFQPRP